MKKINVVLVLFLALSMALSACGGSAPAPAATAAPVKPTEAPAKPAATEAPVKPTEAPAATEAPTEGLPRMDGNVAMTEQEDAEIAGPFAAAIRDAIALEDAGYLYEGYMMPSETTWNDVKGYYTDGLESAGMKLADGLMTFRFDGSEMIAFRDDTGFVVFVVYTPVTGAVAITVTYGQIK